MTIGYPMDLPLTPSFGLLGGFDRKYLGRYFATTLLRANVSVQRGEGGAPLLNLKGEVVGILISSLDRGSASFALPIEAAEKVHRDCQRWDDVHPGWLGLSIVSAEEPRDGSTALIEQVFKNAPAEKAGAKPGDVLLAVGGRKIGSPEDMMDACFFLSAGEAVTLRVARGETELELQAVAADHPAKSGPPRALSLTQDAPSPAETLKIGE
jgi:S1-C subfamily serine protease